MSKTDKVRLQFMPSQPNHLLQLGEDGETLTAGETFEVSEADAEELLTNPGTASQIRRSGSSIDPQKKAEADAPAGAVTEAGAREGDAAPPHSPPSGTAT